MNDIMKPSKDISEIVKKMLLDKENDMKEEGNADKKDNNVQYDIYQIKEKSQEEINDELRDKDIVVQFYLIL